MIKYQARILKDGKGYAVDFPDLPGCFAMGDTLEEAKGMAVKPLVSTWKRQETPDGKFPRLSKERGKTIIGFILKVVWRPLSC